MRCIVACECSGQVRRAMRKRGHDAWSCDLKPAEDGGEHIQGDVLSVLGDRWDMMIAHPDVMFARPKGGEGKPVWANQTPSGQNKLGPSPTRTAERARTYSGIAEAMADQWGGWTHD